MLISLVKKGQSLDHPLLWPLELTEENIEDRKIYEIGVKKIKYKGVVADSNIPMDSPSSWTNRVNHIMEHGI